MGKLSLAVFTHLHTNQKSELMILLALLICYWELGIGHWALGIQKVKSQRSKDTHILFFLLLPFSF